MSLKDPRWFRSEFKRLLDELYEQAKQNRSVDREAIVHEAIDSLPPEDRQADGDIHLAQDARRYLATKAKLEIDELDNPPNPNRSFPWHRKRRIPSVVLSEIEPGVIDHVYTGSSPVKIAQSGLEIFRKKYEAIYAHNRRCDHVWEDEIGRYLRLEERWGEGISLDDLDRLEYDSNQQNDEQQSSGE